MKNEKNHKITLESEVDSDDKNYSSWNPQQWENYLSNLYPEKEHRKEVCIGELIDQIDGNTLASYVATEELKTNYPKIRETLSKLVSKLSPREKTVIEMIFWESKRPVDIAKDLNVGRQTITNAKSRAIMKLRQAIKTTF